MAEVHGRSPAAGLVREHLEGVLVSGGFEQSESLVRMLRFLVNETLEGRATVLKEYTLGVEVFQRGADFDPKIDTIVRTQARRLRAKLEEYYAGAGAASVVRIRLPKGSYVPLFETAAARPRQRLVWAGGALAVVAAAAGGYVWGGILSPTVEAATPDPEAYRLYLKGRLGPKTANSLEFLNKALEVDHRFGPAWLAKADHHMTTVWRAQGEPLAALSQARVAAQQALRSGYDVAAAHAILGNVAGFLDWDWAAATAEFEQAAAMEPHQPLWAVFLARLRAYAGDTGKAAARAMAVSAVDRTGAGAVVVVNQAEMLFWDKRYGEVIALCQPVVDSGPQDFGCRYWTGRALLEQGRPEEVMASLPWPDGTEHAGLLTEALLARGRREEARAVHQRMETAAGYRSPVGLAKSAFALGEHADGFRHLERALAIKDPGLACLKVEPGFARVRADPRFQKILRTVRL